MEYNCQNMKVFLDTNIFMEFFEQRNKCEVVKVILHAVEDNAFCTVVDTSHARLLTAINDESFADIEDSYQYQCALQNGCTQFITINIRDYRDADQTSIEILTPEIFVDKYLYTNS